MKIIITGGAGFIGSHLIDRLLVDGNKILVLDDFSLGNKANLERYYNNENFKWKKCDVSNFKSLDETFKKFKPECIFHLTANSNIKVGAYDVSVDLERTFKTTITILEAMRINNIKKLVFASSSAIFGSKKGRLLEDSGPLVPESNYGAAKLASESFIGAFSKNNDIQTWIFRFPNVCGPRATHGVFFDFVGFLNKDQSQITVGGDGKQSKPYIYVLDLVDAIMVGWKKANKRFNVFNVGNYPLVSVNEILSFLLNEKKIKNINIKYTGVPSWPGDVTTYIFDDSKIRKMGFKPKYNSIEACKRTAKDLLGGK